MTFEEAFRFLLSLEGGYVNDSKDPGGPTKFGLSSRRYPELAIAEVTEDLARELYRRDYWDPAGCDLLPQYLRMPLFDFAVHSGPGTAVVALQQALRVNADGIIGSRTIAAALVADPEELLSKYFAARTVFCTALGDRWDRFGTGWSRRFFVVHGRAVLEAHRSRK